MRTPPIHPFPPRHTVFALLAMCAVLAVLAGCAGPLGGSRAAPAVLSPTTTATATATPRPSATPTLGPARYTPQVLAHGAGSPDDLTLDSQGNVIFSDQADGTIRRINMAQDNHVDVLLQGLNEPEGVIAFEGMLYIAVQGKNSQGVDEIEVLPHDAATAGALISFPNHTNTPGLDGISMDPTTGDLIVADSPNGKIYRVSLNGGVAVQKTTLVASGFVRPTDAIADRAGNIYVADEYGNRVTRIAPNGTVTTLAHLGLPDDLAFDVDGTLLVTLLQGGQLVRLNPATGQVLATLASNLHEPQGLAVDSAGNLYISEELANTVVEFVRG